MGLESPIDFRYVKIVGLAVSVELAILENVEIVGASLSKLIQENYVTDGWSNTIILLHAHPFTIYRGALKVFWLSWHTAGFVTKFIVKFQNTQVAYSSPEIAMQVSHMPAISPARAANDEFLSLTVSGVNECRSCHARLALPEATSTTVHICTTCEWPTIDGR